MCARERDHQLNNNNELLKGDHRVLNGVLKYINRELNRVSNDVIENFLIYKKTQLTQLSSIV